MARNIGVEEGSPDVFRIMVQWTDSNGVLKTRFEGPFPKRGTAAGRISFWERHMKEKYNTDVTGRIDQGTTIWRPEGQAPPEMVDMAMLQRLIEQWGTEAFLYGTASTPSGVPIAALRRTGGILQSCMMQLKATMLHMKKKS